MNTIFIFDAINRNVPFFSLDLVNMIVIIKVDVLLQIKKSSVVFVRQVSVAKLSEL